MKQHCRRYVITVESLNPVHVPALPEHLLRSAIAAKGFRVIDLRHEPMPAEGKPMPRSKALKAERREEIESARMEGRLR